MMMIMTITRYSGDDNADEEEEAGKEDVVGDEDGDDDDGGDMEPGTLVCKVPWMTRLQLVALTVWFR